jgi:ABC-type bacteriocin/lantibiotic exporter with double-glycine peptidase domain
MVFAGLLQAKFMVGFSGQGREAQEAAGQIASESISHIRTVASFTGEQALLEKFVHTLEKNKKSGVNSAHIVSILTNINFDKNETKESNGGWMNE